MSPTLAEGKKLKALADKMVFLTLEEALNDQFAFGDSLVVESVSKERSSNQTFRDDFLYLANTFQEHPHEALPTLTDFGEVNGTLFRTWGDIKFHPPYSPQQKLPPDKERFSLSRLVDGFLHLLTLGVDVAANRLDLFIARDEERYHLARLPLTLKTHLEQPTGSFPILALHFTCPAGSEVNARFQYSLGAQLWYLLSEQVSTPYVSPPILSQTENNERREAVFDEPLANVLGKMTEIEPHHRYKSPTDCLLRLRDVL